MPVLWFQKQPPELFYKKGVLKKFLKFTGKHLCHSSYLIKLQAETCNFIKRETLVQVFSCECSEFFRNIFFREHLRVTASTSCQRFNDDHMKVIEENVWLFYQLMKMIFISLLKAFVLMMDVWGLTCTT